MTTLVEQELAPSQRERIYRHNFVFFLADNILFMVAMGILGATTVIPDFVRHLTNSEILIGLSGSLFTIGFTLPQLFIARYIVRHARKKWWFVGPNIPVRFVLLIFAVITVLLGKDHPELVLIAFFVCYGIAGFGDGLVGVPWSDMTGTSLDHRWRARMLGLTNAATGVIMLLITPLIGVVLGAAGQGFPTITRSCSARRGCCLSSRFRWACSFTNSPAAKRSRSCLRWANFCPIWGVCCAMMCPFAPTSSSACSPACF